MKEETFRIADRNGYYFTYTKDCEREYIYISNTEKERSVHLNFKNGFLSEPPFYITEDGERKYLNREQIESYLKGESKC